jgi:hypothetical protein
MLRRARVTCASRGARIRITAVAISAAIVFWRVIGAGRIIFRRIVVWRLRMFFVAITIVVLISVVIA